MISQQIIHMKQGMQRLIQDLLDLSKLEDPDFKLDICNCELHEVLSDVSRSAHAILKSKKQELVSDIKEGMEYRWGSSTFKTNVPTVIENASKFSEVNKLYPLKC